MVANKPAYQTGYLQAIHHNKSTNLFRTGKRFTAIYLRNRYRKRSRKWVAAESVEERLLVNKI